MKKKIEYIFSVIIGVLFTHFATLFGKNFYSKQYH